jgi:hypothetical protein
MDAKSLGLVIVLDPIILTLVQQLYLYLDLASLYFVKS